MPNMSPTKVPMPQQDPNVRNKNFEEVATNDKYEIPCDFIIKKSSFVILATPVMPLYLPCQCR